MCDNVSMGNILPFNLKARELFLEWLHQCSTVVILLDRDPVVFICNRHHPNSNTDINNDTEKSEPTDWNCSTWNIPSFGWIRWM